MSWFKVDDKFPWHRKLRAVLRGHAKKRRDVAPVGLWVLAGALSDDGFISLDVLEDWDDDARELADRLVSAGLWFHAEEDGEIGYEFHDWIDHNPADASSAGTFGNHVKWHRNRNIIKDDCPHCDAVVESRSRQETRGESGATSGRIASRPDPSRPDPTRISSASAGADPGATDRFDEFWDAYGKKVDRKAAEQKWRLALRKKDVTPDLLISAAAKYVAWERANNQGGRFIMGPAKWLLNERWNDEAATPARPAANLPLAHQIEEPPPGLDAREYDAWFREQHAKHKAAAQ